MKIQVFTFNPFQENTYVVSDEHGEAVIIDPGCHTPDEERELSAYIADHGLTAKYLLNTHCHIDHVLGNAYIKRKFGLDLWAHPLEIPQLASVPTYAPVYGFPQYESTTIDHQLNEGDVIKIGRHELKVLFVPGHAPGHVVFYHQQEGWMIGGDVLFRGSIGRTDLPGGDHQQLLEAIRKRLFPLPDDTVVWPGHGPETTLGFEKVHNPFVGARAEA